MMPRVWDSLAIRKLRWQLCLKLEPSLIVYQEPSYENCLRSAVMMATLNTGYGFPKALSEVLCDAVKIALPNKVVLPNVFKLREYEFGYNFVITARDAMDVEV